MQLRAVLTYPRRRPPLLLVSALAGLASLSLLASACGGSPGSHVAQLGSTTTTEGNPSSSPSNTVSQSTNTEQMLAFSRCVREHGVPNYPDPDSTGHLAAGAKEIAHNSPRFPAAENACMNLLSDGPATQQQRQKKFAFGLKLAQCLRKHGFPTFPDPTASGQSVPSGLDPSSPQFQAAQTTCQKVAQEAVGLP